MELFAYVDETEFKRDNSDESLMLGCGIFFATAPVDQSILTSALLDLERDEKVTDSDRRTLKNHRFHASKDGPRAHFHLCQAINSNLSGKFAYTYFDRSILDSVETPRTQENIFRLSMGLSTNEFFSHQYTKIKLIIEQRQKLNLVNAKKWFTNWMNDYDRQVYQYTSMITYYPDVEIIIADKSNPGLQVVDFLIWAVSRSKRAVPDNFWKDQFKVTFASDFQTENDPQSGGQLSLNRGLPDRGLLNYPVHNVELTGQEFYECYFIIEKTIRALGKSNNKNIQHFQKDIDAVIRQLDFNIELPDRIIFQVATIFIRAFDTVPVYKNVLDTNQSLWRILLKAKKMAGLFLRPELVNALRSVEEVIRWRREVLTNNPNYFDLDYGPDLNI